jgi:hypothetical protein
MLVGLAGVTTAVGFDVAVSEPSSLRAVTWERIRNPASACRRRYVALGAFEIRRQFEASGAPGPSHRNQRNVNVNGSVPLHVPRVVLSTWPTRVVPDTTGSEVLLGSIAVAANDSVESRAANAATIAAKTAAPPTIVKYVRRKP